MQVCHVNTAQEVHCIYGPLYGELYCQSNVQCLAELDRKRSCGYLGKHNCFARIQGAKKSTLCNITKKKQHGFIISKHGSKQENNSKQISLTNHSMVCFTDLDLDLPDRNATAHHKTSFFFNCLSGLRSLD